MSITTYPITIATVQPSIATIQPSIATIQSSIATILQHSSHCHGYWYIITLTLISHLDLKFNLKLNLRCDGFECQDVLKMTKYFKCDFMHPRQTHTDGHKDQWRIQDFPEVGAPTIQRTPTYNLAKFSQKLYEIGRIWTPWKGGWSPKFYYVDPPLKQTDNSGWLALSLINIAFRRKSLCY